MVCTAVDFRKIENRLCEKASFSEGDRAVIDIGGEMMKLGQFHSVNR
jgi:hypothetical protein